MVLEDTVDPDVVHTDFPRSVWTSLKDVSEHRRAIKILIASLGRSTCDIISRKMLAKILLYGDLISDDF